MQYEYGVVLCSMIPVRSEPREQSEMVTQLLFGEYYRIFDEKGSWYKIITQFDQYQGWIDRKLFEVASKSTFDSFDLQSASVLSSVIARAGQPGKPSLFIVAGSNLPDYNGKKGTFHIENRTFQLHRIIHDPVQTRSISDTAEQFLHAPYLWGGRSPFGFDCSGFMQIVYKIHGTALKRDAAQQAEQGRTLGSLSEATQGDLAFFINDKGLINHTGLIISSGQIIHCSGYVRKDRIDEKGIFNSETSEYTHRLHKIIRI
jgi:gamma-D-glutamyl-L-lysine dipeptidyl-peptidase